MEIEAASDRIAPQVVGIAVLMKMAEDRGMLGRVTVEELHETMQARSKLLYLLLSLGLEGKTLTILRGVHYANGLEAWRRLTLEYEPRIVTRSTAMLAGISLPSGKMSRRATSWRRFFSGRREWRITTT